MLQRPIIRRAVGLLLTVQGLFGLLFPKQSIRLTNRLQMRNRYENPDDLQPKDGYVEFTRDLSMATLVFGLLTLWRGMELRDVSEPFVDEDERDREAVTVDSEDTEKKEDTDEDRSVDVETES